MQENVILAYYVQIWKFRLNGYKEEDRAEVERSKSNVNDVILKSKEKYLQTEGAKLTNPETGQKSYWKIINRVMNRCKAP